jgi:DNA-binding transcriptional LysR family regulator
MQREDLGDLAVFMAVAEERSFTRAAARLGTSQSALSHTVRRLEERLGLKLLARTTRSVSPTQAGEQLLATLKPALGEIDKKLAALGRLRDRPPGWCASPPAAMRWTACCGPPSTACWPAIPT